MDRTKDFEQLIPPETRGRPRPKRYSPFDDVTSLRAKVNKLRAHLLKYGHDYLNTYAWVPGASIMSEEQRDKLDQDVEEFINICNDKRNALRTQAKLDADNAQVIKHREAVMDIMNNFLTDFVNFYTLLRTSRMKRNFEKEKYDRIEGSTGRISPSHEFSCSDPINLDVLASIANEDRQESQSRSKNTQLTMDDFQQQSLIAAEHHTSISPDEIQTLAMENSQIHDELMTLDDEVKLIGKKVVQISKLQELFTEKVMEQEMDLNNLHETAIKSSEDVRVGNDFIRDAMMKNASTRVFLLFYIVTLGFTILFLDWYNP